MKRLLFSIFSFILGLALAIPFWPAQVAHAQLNNVLDVQHRSAVAFVKTDRSILYIKRPNATVDAFDIVAMLKQATGNNSPLNSMRHLSVLGMTPDQSQIVLGGDVYYLNPSSSTHQLFEGIFRIPWPLTQARVLSDLPFADDGSPRWFLSGTSAPIGNFHVSGILSPDGSQWFAATQTWSQGAQVMQFFHGHLSGGTVDTAIITQEVAGNKTPPAEGWTESNIALNTTNNNMILVEVDGLEAFASQSQRYLLIHWHPGDPTPYAQDLTGGIQGMSGEIQFAIDSLFAVSCVPMQDGENVEIGLQYLQGKSDTDHDIEYYETRYNSSSPSSLTYDRTLPRSVLPDHSYTFFAGTNTNLYKDDNSSFHEHAQSGDIIVTNDRNTALFITHEWPENQNTFAGSPRNVKSAIFSYAFNGNGKATILYDDSNAQELQPIFVPSTDTIPHVPGITAAATITFPATDTAATATQMLTVTDTSQWDGTYIDSAVITGDNEFTIVSPTFPETIQHGTAGQINLQFAPVGAAGTRTATLTVYSSLSADKTLTINLTGTAKVQQPANGVTEDPSLASFISIEPNPFTSITSVDLTAQDAGALGIVVHDALGHVVYASPVRHAAAGATERFDFDAKSLSLPNGIYYVTALFGDRQISRQVVFVR